MRARPEPLFIPPLLGKLLENHEQEHEARQRAGAGVRRVGVLGGGTAGWMAALALRARLPWLEVTVVESSKIPIIGVGEATVPNMLAFLHGYLGLDIHELTREVRPTWKQGIRFEWGLPGRYAFQAPFDWEVNGVGVLGSLIHTGDINAFTLQAMLMAHDVTPVVHVAGELRSFLPVLPFAYHLDNQRFVRYLTRKALERGVRHVDAGVVDAPLDARASGEPRIRHLVADDGRTLEFDLYVDCSGFRSLLLEQKLSVPFRDYRASLYTDAAIAFNVPHGGRIKPYTTATTMEHGWCWNIPMTESDHLGYVHSSAHCSPDAALAEARRAWPELRDERLVRFRSGRHERLWVGNVYAIGNAYAFVEPLESTGLLMAMRAITALVRAFPLDGDQGVVKRLVNATVARDWDGLRHFLAVHYKFNRRLDSRFWRDARGGVDVSGLSDVLEVYRMRGPLSLLPRALRAELNEAAAIFFYGLAGLDTILLGQGVPCPIATREPPGRWHARHQAALEFVRCALPAAEALRAAWARPEWLRQLVEHPSSWVTNQEAWL